MIYMADEKLKNTNLNYIKNKFLAYFIAARIPTILVTIAFFLLGEWYAINNILLNKTILMIVFFILVEFVLGLTNFAFDKKIDIFSRKQTMWVHNYISFKEMIISSFIFSIVAILILWYYFDLTILFIGIILILLSIFYSLPPIRLKTKPPLDNISNMFFIGTLPFILGWISTLQQLDFNAIFYGLIFGIPVIAHYLILSTQDIKTDKEFGIKTTSVLLGHRWSVNISVILWFFLIVISIFAFQLDISTISFIIVFPLLVLMCIKYQKTNDFYLRQKIINLLLTISTFIWIFFIYICLLYLNL